MDCGSTHRSTTCGQLRLTLEEQAREVAIGRVPLSHVYSRTVSALCTQKPWWIWSATLWAEPCTPSLTERPKPPGVIRTKPISSAR
jgi:hypothetical protein